MTLVYDVDASVAPKANSLDELVKRHEQMPERAAALARARQRISQQLAQVPDSLKTLRLSKGFSQTGLAEAIGTKQAHIARIESGADIQISTLVKLAAALTVDSTELLKLVTANMNNG